MSACPSLNFSCSNISCSIWFCCGGGSNKEHEREQQNQKQPAAVPSNNPQPSPPPPPPPPQVIKVPDHLREPASTTYVEKPAAPQPPAPLPSHSYTPPIAETAPHPRREPRTHTYYPPGTEPPPPPSTTQQQATRPPTLQTPTLPALAPPPKVYDSWTQTTLYTHPAPVWSSQTQTPSSAPILPPGLASPPNKVLDDMGMGRPHMPMIPASDAQSAEMVHSKPPRPARQPSKTYQTMPPTVDVDQLHPAHSRLPSENYYYDEAALPDVVPLPLGDSQHYVGFYAQERWE